MVSTSEPPHPEARAALIAQLMELSADDFASRHLLDRVPWLFSDRRQYIDWKSSLASDLELDPFMLLIVGSAGLGFSLSPYKDFATFGARSDVDVAAVSMRHFDEAWRWLRERGPENLDRDKLEREMFKWHRRNLVFDGVIATDRLLPMLPFGSRWVSGLGKASRREPTRGRIIKVRLYRDFESLRRYHVNNLREWKLRLLEQEPSVPPGLTSKVEDEPPFPKSEAAAT